MKYIKTFESHTQIKFIKQPKKKSAKTDTYNVLKGGNVIGQVKWSSRMRGYAFLPTTDCSDEIKEFTTDLMKKYRADKKKNKLNENVSSDLDEIISDVVDGSYTINDNGLIDVVGNVYLDIETARLDFGKTLKFGKVSGDFESGDNQLTSLEGSPIEVGGNYRVSNNRLLNLDYCPQIVGGDFICHENMLTSLEGSPIEVGGDFYCDNNKLINLIGCTTKVSELDCSNNLLTSLEGCPTDIDFLICNHNKLYDFYGMGNIMMDMSCGGNPVFEIYLLHNKLEFAKYLNEFRPIRGYKVLVKRLQECLYMCDIEMSIDKITSSIHNYTLLE